MRSVHLSILLAMAAVPAAAQSYSCDRPRKPDVPSGYSADYDDMDRFQDDYISYLNEIRDYVAAWKQKETMRFQRRSVWNATGITQ